LIRLAPRLRNQLAGYQITRSGLSQIGSDLPVPRVDLRRYWHDVGVVWLWLTARNGVFGEIERVFSERKMRAADKVDADAKYAFDLELSPAVRAKAAYASFGATLESDIPGDPLPVQYPDLCPGRSVGSDRGSAAAHRGRSRSARGDSQTFSDSSDRAHRVSEGLRCLANVCYQ
jgi:hypothetical protein